jgi:hypothetical protein
MAKAISDIKCIEKRLARAMRALRSISNTVAESLNKEIARKALQDISNINPE